MTSEALDPCPLPDDSSPEPTLHGSAVVRIAILGEGALLLIGLPWLFLREHGLSYAPTADGIFHGILITIPLLFLNTLLYLMVARFGWPRSLRQFQREFLLPLCKELSAVQAAIIALLSGVGEEILFRGLLNVELSNLLGTAVGVGLTSLVFAAIHLIGNIRRFLFLLLLYTVVALYYSWVTINSGDLTPAITSHTVFNFCSLLWLRRVARTSA